MPALLFLAQRLPYPPDKGEKIRAWHELQLLARHYDIYLGALIDDPADRAHVDALRPFCRDIRVVGVNRRAGRAASLLGLLTGQALSVRYFQNGCLAAWVRDVLSEVEPETIFIYSSNMAPYVLDLPRGGRLVTDLVDVDSEKWRALCENSGFPMRVLYRREAQRIAALEARVARESDACLFVSLAEMLLFTHRHPEHAARAHAISNGVDHRFFAPTAQPPATPPEFVFTGTMDYPPNIDAVVWFATEILPLIRRVDSQARFTIVGSQPADAVRRLARLNGVMVTGRVPDVRPYLARATAAVAPMRIARGIQNKVLEAMAMGRPVVLTSGALEGIKAIAGQEVLLADTVSTFAEACCRLLDTTLGAAVGSAARARILADYDWRTTLRPLYDIVGIAAACAADSV
jgi:sugar transferase (PEP-CTERM/EpsH1 system associated)